MADNNNSQLRRAPIYVPVAPSSTTLAGIITTGAAAISAQVIPTAAGFGGPGKTEGWWDFYALGADAFVVFSADGTTAATIACTPILIGTTERYFLSGDRAFVSAITAGSAGSLRWVPSSR